ncbi:hypothetical protein AAHC03_013216 [Spirometra sp. Aus1]
MKITRIKNHQENLHLNDVCNSSFYLLARLDGDFYSNEGEPLDFEHWTCDAFDILGPCTKRLNNGQMTTNDCEEKLPIVCDLY